MKRNTIKFKAISPIKKGDELTICYVYPLDLTTPPTTEAWKSYIASTQGFDCICEFCRSKDPKMLKKLKMKELNLGCSVRNTIKNATHTFSKEENLNPQKLK